MADDGWLLAQKARIDTLNATIQGMIAENLFTMNTGDYAAYGEEHFQEIATELEGIYQEIMENR